MSLPFTLNNNAFSKKQTLYNRGIDIDPAEEQRKQASAKYLFTFSSPYKSSQYLATPHVHKELKLIIEEQTNNKVYVNIADGGQHGVGSSLANHVKFNLSQGALLSIANLAPICPAIDLINIPYWCNSDNKFLALFKNPSWIDHIDAQLRKHNLTLLFPYLTGSRTASTLRHYNKPLSNPSDLQGINIRVSNSQALAKFYEIAGANVQNIMWGLAAKTARRKRYEALDSGVIGLFSGPDNLKLEIGTITRIDSVQDAWVAIANNEFLASLDSKTRSQFNNAIDSISEIQRTAYLNCDKYCSTEFQAQGTKIVELTDEQKLAFINRFGPDRAEWKPFIKEHLGGEGFTLFNQLREYLLAFS
ncbi:TRAP transporter substrate-binding protein [Pleionea sediminis]|uniref:TRAP transporter substrate-binding protein n=1 Tax=Pleionea sediminis TaxID=2569479 RepID=UPI0013DDA3EF|nr:TRAP transporter substrate-binding protein DctP [Pleionea sediminis]